MKEIVERLMDSHRINEMTKHDALSKLQSMLQSEYPDCDVSFNRYHNCLEVSKDGVVHWQVYPDRSRVESKSYKYVRVDDPSSLPPGTPLYIREPRDSHYYKYSCQHSTRKHVDNIIRN